MDPKRLSPLEHEVMKVIWSGEHSTADDVRIALGKRRQLTDSTVRTLLRRMEEKGFVTHEVDGRTYVYRPAIEAAEAATGAIRQIIDRFCGGSVEALLIGLVSERLVDSGQLQELADRVARAELPED